MILEFKQPPKTDQQILLGVCGRTSKKYLKSEGMTTEEIIKVIHPFLLFLRRYGMKLTGNNLRISRDFTALISQLLGKLTPREIMTYYPITKDFTAERYEIKGYRHTIEYLETLEMDKPLGATAEEAGRVMDFLWEYQNPYIKTLGIMSIKTLDKFQEIRGAQTLQDMILQGGKIRPAARLSVIKGGRESC